MQSLKFVFEATLLAPLVEFATSTSGHVEPRQGLALGWLGSVVAGLAVVFGTADRAQADSCHGISEGPGLVENCGWACSSDPCKYDHNGNPIGWYEKKYCHSETLGCRLAGVSSSCTC
ncbi:MAG: hypothetical protein F4Z85_16380 [Gemmatimonadetes bacterium]|nr:hypothetical protein [Gemmatimonadota bacterium]MYB69776.1 hypothetical protein [Gemmatimonadota bacterium]